MRSFTMSMSIFMMMMMMMMLPSTISASDVASTAKHGEVIILTDDNFDEFTSGSSSGEDGDSSSSDNNNNSDGGQWMIEFYAPWCGHCKSLAPVWAELAAELAGSVNVASVDCTRQQSTAKRFNVRGYPTIKFVTNGQVYAYDGRSRGLDDLRSFAVGGYVNADSEPVPATMSTLAAITAEMRSAMTDIKSLVLRKPEASLVIFICGLFVGVTVSIMIFTCCIDVRSQQTYSSEQQQQRGAVPRRVPGKTAPKTSAVPADVAAAKQAVGKAE